MNAGLTDAAARLRSLHRGGEPLVLPNAWDAASARRFTSLGVPALATSSAAIAHALGHPDHEGIPPALMFETVSRIAAAVDVPVTADLEAGYGLAPADLVDRLLGAGCAGLNLEDTDHATGQGALVDPARQAERLSAVKAAGRAAGVDVVLNARVDVYVSRIPSEQRLAEAVRRGRLYLEAGADCVYPIFVQAEEDIAALVSALGGPVNVMALPNGPSVGRLGALGVARVSFGALPMKAALDGAERWLRDRLSGAADDAGREGRVAPGPVPLGAPRAGA